MSEPTASLYIQLNHPQYKALEEQLRNWAERETAHTSTEGFYHKSISFIVAGIRWEFHGPIVKAAEPDDRAALYREVFEAAIAEDWGDEVQDKVARIVEAYTGKTTVEVRQELGLA